MVLNAKRVQMFAFESFQGVIIEIYVGQFDIFIFKRIDIDAETMILRSDFDLACFEIFHGMICAAMAEF